MFILFYFVQQLTALSSVNMFSSIYKADTKIWKFTVTWYKVTKFTYLSIFNFLPRNPKYCPKQVKQTAYLLLLPRPICYRIPWRHLESVSTEGQGQARKSHSACSKIRGKWLRPTQQLHCNTPELGLVILGTPSTKPTSDLDVWNFS